jgi:tetratricopeptide (TPR) repeat protein
MAADRAEGEAEMRKCGEEEMAEETETERECCYNLGCYYVEQQQLAEAQLWLERSQLPAAWYNVAMLLPESEEQKKMQLLEKAAESDNVAALVYLGQHYANRQDPDRSVGYFRSALRLGYRPE